MSINFRGVRVGSPWGWSAPPNDIFSDQYEHSMTSSFIDTHTSLMIRGVLSFDLLISALTETLCALQSF